MFKIQQKVGRLVEAHVTALEDVTRVDAYGAAFAPVLERVHGRPVLCADHRPVVIYAQPVTDRLTELFRSLNKTWERVAIVVAPTNATLAMQLNRIVRESQNLSRRVFFDPKEATRFLSEILDPAEESRLRAFIEGR